LTYAAAATADVVAAVGLGGVSGMSARKCDLQCGSDEPEVCDCGGGAVGEIFFCCMYGEGGWPLICGDVLESPLLSVRSTLVPPLVPLLPVLMPAPPPLPPVPPPLPLTPPPPPLLLLPPLPPPPGDWFGGDDDESPTHVPHMSTVCLGTSESDD